MNQILIFTFGYILFLSFEMQIWKQLENYLLILTDFMYSYCTP